MPSLLVVIGGARVRAGQQAASRSDEALKSKGVVKARAAYRLASESDVQR